MSFCQNNVFLINGSYFASVETWPRPKPTNRLRLQHGRRPTIYKSGHNLQNPRKSCPHLFFHHFRIRNRTNHLSEVREAKTKRRTPHGDELTTTGGEGGAEAGSPPHPPALPRVPPWAAPGPSRSTEGSQERRRGQSRSDPHPRRGWGGGVFLLPAAER